MDYSFLTPDEKLAMLRVRLAEMERRHYDLVLQDASLPSMDHDTQLAEITETIEFFRSEIEAAEKAKQ